MFRIMRAMSSFLLIDRMVRKAKALAGQQFKVIQTINFTKVMPGESITLESMESFVADPSVDISIVEAPRPSNK
jgi:hypothetical protein